MAHIPHSYEVIETRANGTEGEVFHQMVVDVLNHDCVIIETRSHEGHGIEAKGVGHEMTADELATFIAYLTHVHETLPARRPTRIRQEA